MPPESSMASRRILMTVLVGMALVRLWLGGAREIVPDEADSSAYAYVAANYFGKFSQLPSYPPGIAVLPALFRLFGIPYKLGLDLLMIFVCAAAARWMLHCSRSALLSGAAFAALAFHPWFLQSSLAFMSEPVLGLVLLAATLAAATLLAAPIHQWSPVSLLTAGGCFAYWVAVRPEDMIALPAALGFALTAGIRNRSRLRNAAASPFRLAGLLGLICVPVLAVLASSQAIKAVHYFRYGVAARTSLETPAFKKLATALYSIRPISEQRFLPVPLSSLEAAFSVSPTLARNRETVLRAKGPGEMGTRLNWVLVNSFKGTPQEKEEQMSAAAKEIRLAFSDGTLPHRFAVYPLDPLSRFWLPEWPASFLRCVVLSAGFGQIPVPREEKLNIFPATDRLNFERALLLRDSLFDMNTLAVSGGQSSGAGSSGVRYVIVRNNDIPVGLAPILPGRGGGVFNLRLEGATDWDNLTLAFHSGDTNSTSMETKPSGSRELAVSLPGGTEHWTLGFKRIKAAPGPADRLTWNIIQYYPVAFGGLLFVVAGISFLRARRGEAFDSTAIKMGVLAAAVIVLLRSAFYSLADVTLRWTTWRYMGPDSLILAFAAMGCSVSIGNSAGRIIKLLFGKYMSFSIRMAKSFGHLLVAGMVFCAISVADAEQVRYQKGPLMVSTQDGWVAFTDMRIVAKLDVRSKLRNIDVFTYSKGTSRLDWSNKIELKRNGSSVNHSRFVGGSKSSDVYFGKVRVMHTAEYWKYTIVERRYGHRYTTSIWIYVDASGRTGPGVGIKYLRRYSVDGSVQQELFESPPRA